MNKPVATVEHVYPAESLAGIPVDAYNRALKAALEDRFPGADVTVRTGSHVQTFVHEDPSGEGEDSVRELANVVYDELCSKGGW